MNSQNQSHFLRFSASGIPRASIRAIRGLSFSLPPSAIRSPHSSSSGSALVLVLLITALLTTIAVSFLSTSRIEQIAAKNFTRQNAASGLAEMATQEAMANIALGFNFSGNLTQGLDDDEYAQVVTTQSGAIHKYIFQNGTVTRNGTIELFSSGNQVVHITSSNNTTTTPLAGNATSNTTAYLNNLRNPSSNSTLTSNSSNNRWTITGNAAEEINVPMEEVKISENGTDRLIGRIAYYVDDDGTKINLNGAAGDRPTLNVGSSRSLSLNSTLESQTLSANFTNIINGNSTSNSSINTWNYFFRPDQLFGAVPDIDPEVFPNLSTETADHHMKRTPWGTERLFINDLPLNETGVNAIYEALSGKNATTGLYHTGNGTPSPNQYELNGLKLREIYGENMTFAEKYSDAGLKQIAANILQARDPDTLNDFQKYSAYNGTLIGAEAVATDTTTGLVAIADCCSAVKQVIPKDYMGLWPHPFINELGVTVVWTCDYGSNTFHCRLNIRPFISIARVQNDNRTSASASTIDEWEIEMQIDSFEFDVHYNDGSTGTYGPSGFENGDAWGHTWAENRGNAIARDQARGGVITEGYLGGSGPWSYRFSGFSNIGGTSYTTAGQRAPDWGGAMQWSGYWQLPCPPYPDTDWSLCAQVKIPQSSVDAGLQIDSIDNIRIKFEYIRLIAKSGDDTTIRDWVLAEDTGVIPGSFVEKHPFDPNPGGPASKYPGGVPRDLNDQMRRANDPSTGKRTFPIKRSETPPPALTIKRIDGRLRTSAAMADSPGYPQWDYMRSWSGNGTENWVNDSAGEIVKGSHGSNPYSTLANPSVTLNNLIPGDQCWGGAPGSLYFAYSPRWSHLSNNWPSLDSTNPADLKQPGDADSAKGVFTCPADLGKIHTNVQHRKLRMTTQHPNEVGSIYNGLGGNFTFIPDWAMLDVVSFGSNGTTVPAPAPINLNGKFHVPPTTPSDRVPAPRTAGLESMLKSLDTTSSGQLGNPFNPSQITSTVSTTGRGSYHDAYDGLSADLVNNVHNLSWTSGNGKFNAPADTSTWGYDPNNDPATLPDSRRASKYFPSNKLVLPSEVTEISGVSDYRFFNSGGQDRNMKGNEGRLSAFFPGATTQSRHFTIYAYAQALDQQGNVESDKVTKTLVEVEEVEPATNPPTYKVKKLYTQQIAAE